MVVTGAEDSGHRGDSAGLDLRSHGERFCFLWGRWFVLRAGSRLVKLAARTAGDSGPWCQAWLTVGRLQAPGVAIAVEGGGTRASWGCA